MKKLVFMALAATFMTACGTIQQGGDTTKAGRKEARRNMVVQALDNRRYTIGVSAAYPARHPQVILNYGYSLEIAGDTIRSYLPYYGRAYNIPYGGGKALNFTGIISQYAEKRGRQGTRHIEMLTTTDEDTYLYTIDVSDNGYATIDVSAKERERISFSGEMEIKMP